MGEQKAETRMGSGVKIVRPGARYYFDGGVPTCPVCNSIDLEYRCRVQGTPRTAQFKCRTCSCKFEKTRTVKTEPEGYTPESRGTRGLALVCKGCGLSIDLSLDELAQVEELVCKGCGAVLKDQIGQQA